MSKESYCIPKGVFNRYNFQRDTVEQCKTNGVEWGVSPDKLTLLIARSNTYTKKYQVTANPTTQSPGATAARNTAWKELKISLIDIYDHHLINNESINIEHKKVLHINLNEEDPIVSSPPPTTTPIITLTTEGVSTLRIIYSDSDSLNTHKKPDNVVFCEICCKIGDPAPTSIDECLTRFNISRSHQIIVFKPEERGKIIHVYPRWVNRNGKVGTFGNKVTAMIP